MTEKYLDISCPICGKRDKAGWWDSDDDGIFMFCMRCYTTYLVMNDSKKKIVTHKKEFANDKEE